MDWTSVNNMEDESSRTDLLEQIWYYQDKVSELEEQLDELQLENDDLRYDIHELKKGNKGEKSDKK